MMPHDNIVTAQLQHFCSDVADARGFVISEFGQSLRDICFGHRVYATVVICLGILRRCSENGVCLWWGMMQEYAEMLIPASDAFLLRVEYVSL